MSKLKIFISYSHTPLKDNEWVQSLAQKLREQQYCILIDSEREAGQTITGKMHSSINDSDIILVICSKEYVNKANSQSASGVKLEYETIAQMQMERQYEKKVIPVIINKKKERPILLMRKEYVDFSNDRDSPNAFQNLLTLLEKEKKHLIMKKTQLEDAQFTQSLHEEIDDFNNRFSRAFPGVRGIQKYEKKEDIRKKLLLFFQKPIPSSIWWYRGTLSYYISEFEKIENEKFIMNGQELKISKLIAFNRFPNNSFLYIETFADVETGLYQHTDASKQWYIENFGSLSEEFGVYKNKHLIKREEYDDGYAIINGKSQRLNNGNLELRTRYLTPYNFLIAAHHSSIIQYGDDNNFKLFLNKMLNESKTIQDLDQFISTINSTAK